MRISIQFKNKRKKSVVIYSHYSGNELLVELHKYMKELKSALTEAPELFKDTPLARLEPDTVIVDFVRYLTQDIKISTGDYYLKASEPKGEAYHYVIDLWGEFHAAD